ncbi:MAG: 3-ketoacyl-ACP reductase [Rhodocyclaceae bacterium]
MTTFSTKPVAVVTGSARGIGKGCAVRLAQSGYNILINDLPTDVNRAALEATADELRALGADVAIHACDVADLATHEALVAAALHRWGRIDCWVNNAGVTVKQRGDMLDATPESFDFCIDVNTKAVFFLCQRVARHMIEQGQIGAQHRSIVNITSCNVEALAITRAEYCISKTASSMTTKLFALRLAEHDIGVYEIRPGIIETDMTKPVKARYDKLIAEGIVPMKRWGYPADIASTVNAMAQGQLCYTVGQAVTIGGGLTLPHF